MLEVCGKGEEAEYLGLVSMKSGGRIPGVGVGRRLRLLRLYQKNARAARKQTPMGMPTPRPMSRCLAADNVELCPVPLLAAELIIVLWLPSDVTICVTNSMLGLLEPAVDRLLLEVTFVGLMLVENV